jgi:hypothetical protein
VALRQKAYTGKGRMMAKKTLTVEDAFERMITYQHKRRVLEAIADYLAAHYTCEDPQVLVVEGCPVREVPVDKVQIVVDEIMEQIEDLEEKIEDLVKREVK